ncbi:MAG: diguanylate cyclase [Acidobacteria bacterium]|nr:diguanylate cyclase [Acidobacteriota bacterium]
MQTDEQTFSTGIAGATEISASVHQRIELLSNRLAELSAEGTKFEPDEIGEMVEHLNVATALTKSCRELIGNIRAGASADAPKDSYEEASDADGAGLAAAFDESASRSHTSEDDLFPPGRVSDTLTGLPGRDLGIRAIQSARSMGRPRYGVVFAVDRLRYMVTRYGTDAGQMSLRQYSQFLAHKLPSDAMMFRWGGSSMLALFDTNGMLADVRHLADHTGSHKVKLNYESQQRSVLLNLTASAWAVSLTVPPTELEIVQELDNFVFQHSRKQPE